MKKFYKPGIYGIVLLVVLSACGPSAEEKAATETQDAANFSNTQTAAAPTPTFTPLPTPTPSQTPEPTATHTPDPYANLPEPPEGYDWVIAPESRVAFLSKEDWYYLEEFEGDSNNYFVSQENINEIGYFSTGFSMFVFTRFDGNPLEFAENFITYMAQQESTTEVLVTLNYEEGDLISYKIMIETEYDKPTYSEADRYKTLIYITLVNKTNDYVYLIIFESPTEDWEAQEGIAEILLTNIQFFDE